MGCWMVVASTVRENYTARGIKVEAFDDGDGVSEAAADELDIMRLRRCFECKCFSVESYVIKFERKTGSCVEGFARCKNTSTSLKLSDAAAPPAINQSL